MELGGPNEEMVFDDFEQTYKWITHMIQRAKERKILTATEHSHLKKLKNKLKSYSDIQPDKLDSLKRKINYLLNHYSTYYNS